MKIIVQNHCSTTYTCGVKVCSGKTLMDALSKHVMSISTFCLLSLVTGNRNVYFAKLEW